MAKQYTILMADIIKSSQQDQKALMREFKHIISATNSSMRDSFLSPMTITLGDEFQSLPHSLSAAIGAIFKIEEEIVNQKMSFKLRYVIVEGKIETPINRAIAHEMLGPGLTKARELLGLIKKKSGTPRFHVAHADAGVSEALNNAFLVLQAIVDGWRLEKDYNLVSKFLEYLDYKVVAAKTHKTRSQIWKRRRSLMIEEYLAIKSVIQYIGGMP